MTGQAKHFISAVVDIKREYPDVFCIVGGIHPTFHTEMIHETAFDALCVGEGEGAWADVLECLSSGGTIDCIGQIPNIITKDSPATEVRPLIEDLDTLPHPDWGLVYDNTRLGQGSAMKIYMAGRSCPFNCHYCWNANIKALYEGKGKLVRRHSVDYVIEGMKRIKDRWPVSTLKIYDDMLLYSGNEWEQEFAERYSNEIGLPFFAFCRAELATEPVIKLLAHAGCRVLSMSIEAGNDTVRRELMNRRMTNKQIIDAHLLAKKYGIMTFTNVILGMPGTTIDHDIESLDLAIASEVDHLEMLIFQPFPGTWLGDYCVEKGYYDPDYEHLHSGYHFRSPLTCFTEAQKDQQQNMTTMGVVVALLRWKWLRDWFVKHGIYWRNNKLFLFAYFVIKMYVMRKKLYPTKLPLRENLKMFWGSWKQEVWKHTEEKG
jgi:radical SAM superfamily enzyme YgiQ (UPF0313 family)